MKKWNEFDYWTPQPECILCVWEGVFKWMNEWACIFFNDSISKIKVNMLGSRWMNYIAMQYTSHVFRLCVFVYCTCAKLNLSLSPKNVETWLHCCFHRMWVHVCRKDPICQCQYQLQSKDTHSHIRFSRYALIMWQKIINIIYLFS